MSTFLYLSILSCFFIYIYEWDFKWMRWNEWEKDELDLKHCRKSINWSPGSQVTDTPFSPRSYLTRIASFCQLWIRWTVYIYCLYIYFIVCFIHFTEKYWDCICQMWRIMSLHQTLHLYELADARFFHVSIGTTLQSSLWSPIVSTWWFRSYLLVNIY